MFLFFQSMENPNRVVFIKETPRGNHLAYLEGQKVIFVDENIRVGDIVDKNGKVLKSRNPLLGSFEDFRLSIYEKIKDNLNYPVSALVGAITLGIRQEIPSSVKAYFSLSGLYPFLAISGLHVGIVVGFLGLIFKTLRFKKPYTTSCLVLFPLMPLTGFPPSVVRAYFLSLFLSLGFESFRKISPVYLLGVVFLFTLLLNKESVGATLSFLAVFGIFVALEIVKGKWKTIFLASLAPMLFTLPVVLYLFGTVNLASPLNSLVATVLFVPLLILSFLAEITLFKIGFINDLLDLTGKALIILSQELYSLTKVFIIHTNIPLTFASVVILLSLLLYFKRPFFSFIPLVFLLIISIVFQKKIENKTFYVKGWKLHSFYFLSTEGQSYKNCKIYSDYVFPFARKFLQGNVVIDKRLERSRR
ncbi:MAG: ComEC/Rec2 family competence protein [Desulfurobacteriaceae bacterium]